MATIGNLAVTFNDLRKRQAPDGSIDHVIEVLKQTNPIMDDIKWMAGNLPTGNQTTLRTSLPEVYLRQINRGVPVSKSTTQQIVDVCCIIEAQSQIDVDLLALQKDPQAFRKSEDDAFVEAMSQKVAKMFFYGDAAKNADEFNGFSKRFGKLSDKKGDPGNQIIDAGGTKANALSSAWLVGWGDRSVAGIYPEYGYAGLKFEDGGIDWVTDKDGHRFKAAISSFKWKPGLAVMDYQMAAALRNIDTAALLGGTATAEDKEKLFAKFIMAKNKIRNINGASFAWYVPDQVYTFLETFLQDKHNVYITQEQKMASIPSLRLLGIPVKKVDALTNTEAQVK